MVNHPPPFTQSPTLSGWTFFRSFPLCWRGSARLPLERHPGAGGRPGALAARFLSLFSVRLLSVLPYKPSTYAGLRASGCALQLVGLCDRDSEER